MKIQFQSMDDLLSYIGPLSQSCYFRGYQQDCELISSLGRRSCDGKKVFQKFVELLYQNGFPEMNFKELLCLAQHYGIPTNLIDFTTDPYVALFFALGKEPSGKFHILFANIEDFKSEHKHQLRSYPITLKALDNMLSDQLDSLPISSLCSLSEETKISQNYIKSGLLDSLYEEFFFVQSQYILVEYTEKSFLRIQAQSGLFILSSNKTEPVPTDWFNKIDVSLPESEVKKLVDYLDVHNYNRKELLPPCIGGINVEKIAKEIMK